MTAVPPPPRALPVQHPDGRVPLPEGAVLPDTGYVNDHLHPLPMARRRWSTYSFSALWVGMAVNIPSWTLASGLIALGMDWRQAVLTIALANVIVLAPMVLTGHTGAEYGIPFPVFARASFGVRGADLPALLRGAVACGWFGIQTWIGGQGVFVILGRLLGPGWSEAPAAGGFGPLLSEPSQLGWGPEFWVVFFPALMGMIGFWSTLSLNISDFTRFSSSQRAQIRGQSLGLPTTMAAFALLSVLVASGSRVVYGEALWNPADIAARMESTAGVLFALVIVLMATISTNIAANLAGPAYDLSNLAPRLFTFRTGAMATCVISVLIFPWRLLENPSVYIFTWLGTVGGLLGTVAGILIADYWILRRTRMRLDGLYTRDSAHWYSGGWNWRALAAFAVGAVLAVGGSHSAPGEGPFPEAGLIPFLSPLADYGWAVGFAAALTVHAVLGRAFPAVGPPTGSAPEPVRGDRAPSPGA